MKAYVNRKVGSAHFLPGYDGKCANMHGHTWLIEVWLEGEVYEKTGMLVDFKLIKNVIDRYDHGTLNDFMPNPTAENMVKKILRTLADFGVFKSVRVRVWESDNSYAEDETHPQKDERYPDMKEYFSGEETPTELENKLVGAEMTALEFRRATDGKFEPLTDHPPGVHFRSPYKHEVTYDVSSE